MPEQGIYKGHEHAVRVKGKRARNKRGLWEGLAAPGEALPFAFALSVCLGAMVYLSLPFEPNLLLAVAVGLIMVLLVLLVLAERVGGALRVALILGLGSCLGFLAGKARAYTVDTPSISKLTGPVMLEGWIKAVEPGQNGIRLRIKPHAIAGLNSLDLPETVRLTHRLDLKMAPGRFVRCWSVLRPPPGPAIPGDFDFQRQAWFQRLGGVGYVQGRCRGGALGVPSASIPALQLQIGAYRRRLAEYTYAVSGEGAGGFAAALVSGDRSFMSPEDQETLRASGLAHLLAISGLHLGIVGGLVYFLFRIGLAAIQPLSLRYPVQKFAAIAALLAITIYLVISGASVSTQRAFIMSAVFFSAILIDRPALSLRSFSVAMIGVVLLAPESIFSPGFQMSFAATGVLIAIYEAWARHRAHGVQGLVGRTVFAGKSLIVTSVAASAATAPFALFHFERLAPLGLIANLGAMPVVSLMSVPSAGLALLLAPFGKAEWGLRLFGGSLEVVMAIARWTENAGLAFAYPLKSMPDVALLCFVATLVSIVLFRRWFRLLSAGITLFSGVLVWYLTPLALIYWAPSGEVYINLEASQYQEVSFAEGDGLGPLRLGRVAEGPQCEDKQCTYETATGVSVVLLRDASVPVLCGTNTLILSLEKPIGPQQDCVGLVLWDDVKNLGGVALYRDRGGTEFRRRHASTCSARPWRRCS